MREGRKAGRPRGGKAIRQFRVSSLGLGGAGPLRTPPFTQRSAFGPLILRELTGADDPFAKSLNEVVVCHFCIAMWSDCKSLSGGRGFELRNLDPLPMKCKNKNDHENSRKRDLAVGADTS